MFTRYQICRYLNCMHKLIIYVCFSLRVDRFVSWSLLFTLRFSPCILCVQYRGDIMITVGDIMMHMGDIMMHVGILWVPWGCSLPWEGGGGESSLSSLQWTTWALIHVWDPPLKQLPSQQQIHWCFWAVSSLSSLQQTSRVSYGTHLYKCFRAASTLSSLQQTLRVSCGAPHETRFHTIATG